ncbi:MAG: TetR/AcrR family transcriptional regulator [Chitinophagaceae bacterium]|nr:TetR/AcrR family transcriptional regulator [Chitinophagaceae bacterium]
MKSTKQHILNNALKLFNNKGVVNVRLQHIADEAFVSIGHLAYHFKNKDAIVGALYDDLQQQQQQLLNEHRTVPLFTDIDAFLRAYYALQNKYIFFYLDSLEITRAYADIAKKHTQHIQWQRTLLNVMLQFNISRGSLIPIKETGVTQLSTNLRMQLDNWRYANKVEGVQNDTVESFLNAIWASISPYFTPMGIAEYKMLVTEPQ